MISTHCTEPSAIKGTSTKTGVSRAAAADIVADDDGGADADAGAGVDAAAAVKERTCNVVVAAAATLSSAPPA